MGWRDEATSDSARATDQDTEFESSLTKAPQRPSQPPMTGWQQFRQGVRTGLQAIPLGIQQTGAEVGERLGLVAPETVNELRAQEEARRQMSLWGKTQAGGQPGFRNPASWGEASAEYGLPMLLPGGQARTIGQAIKGGAVLGGLSGATAPLTPEESRMRSALKGAAIGGAGAGVIKGGVEAAKAVPRIARETARNLGARIEGTYAAEQGAKTVESAMNRVMPRATSKDKKYTSGSFAADKKSDYNGIEFLHRPENADILPVVNGEKVAAKDLNAVTQFEAIENGIDKVLKQQDAILKQAGGQGVVFDKNKLVDFWINEAKKAEKLVEGGPIAKVAREKIAALKGVDPNQLKGMSWQEIKALEDVRGVYDLDSALSDLTILNNELKRGNIPIEQSVKGAIGREADLRRGMLDDVGVSKELRRDLGSLLSLRDRTGKVLSKLQKTPDTGLLGVGDYALAQMAYGALTANPAIFGKGALIAAKKKLLHTMREPNAVIEHMHRKFAEGYRPKIKTPERPYYAPQQPTALPEGRGYIDAEFSEVTPPQLPAPQKTLPPPTRQLPASTAMPTGSTPGSSFAGRPTPPVAGMTEAEIEASARRIAGRPSVRAESAATPKDKRTWKGVENFAKQFGLTIEEAARILDEAAAKRGR